VVIALSIMRLITLSVIITLYIIKVGFIPQKSTGAILASMKEGITFIRAQEGMGGLIVLSFMMTMLGIPLITFLPVFAKEVLHGDSNTFAQLLVTSGVGSICGALMVAGLGKIKGQGFRALLMLILLGVVTVVFARSTSVLLSSLMMFLAAPR